MARSRKGKLRLRAIVMLGDKALEERALSPQPSSFGGVRSASTFSTRSNSPHTTYR